MYLKDKLLGAHKDDTLWNSLWNTALFGPQNGRFFVCFEHKTFPKDLNSQFHLLINVCRPVKKNQPHKFLKKLQCVDFGPTIASLGQIRYNINFIWKYNEQIQINLLAFFFAAKMVYCKYLTTFLFYKGDLEI